MRDPIIFLDIDGVLNRHKFNREAQSGTLCRPCVLQLNRVIRATGAKVVLSSAWRYMVHGGAMNLLGFGYMLRTHGLTEKAEIIGVTASDETCAYCGAEDRGRGGKYFGTVSSTTGEQQCGKCGLVSGRAEQVRSWILANRRPPQRFIVIDDLDLGFTAWRLPFVHTNGKMGLTRRKADEAKRLLAAPAKRVEPGSGSPAGRENQ